MGEDERAKILATLAENPHILLDSVAADTEERKRSLEEKREQAKIEAEKGRSLNRMRTRWSNGLLVCIIGIVFFDFLFVFSLGKSWISFENQSVVFTFLTESLVKIAYLAYVVVKALFDKDLLGHTSSKS